jgi:hypothetical protein
MGFLREVGRIGRQIAFAEAKILPIVIGAAIGGVTGTVVAGGLSRILTVQDQKATPKSDLIRLVRDENARRVRQDPGSPLLRFNRRGFIVEIPRLIEGPSENVFTGSLVREQAERDVRTQDLGSMNVFGSAAGGILEEVQAVRKLVEDPERAANVTKLPRLAQQSIFGLFSGAKPFDLDVTPGPPEPTQGNLSVRISDTPPTGGKTTINPRVAAPETPQSRTTVAPTPSSVLTTEEPMAGFFESLGDKLLAAAPDIIRGFSAGGISGGLLAAGSAAVGVPQIARSPTISPVFPTAATGGTSSVGAIQPQFVGAGPLSILEPSPFQSVRQFDTTLGRLQGGIVGGLAGAVLTDPKGAFQSFGAPLPRVDIGSATRPGGTLPLVQPLPTVGPQALPAPRMGGSNFAKDNTGATIKFFMSPRPGEGWIPVVFAAQAGLKPVKPFARFDLATQRFVKIPRRRMNPCNLKALGRAKRRQEDFLDLVIPMVRDRKKEAAGKKPTIRTKRRKKKKC